MMQTGQRLSQSGLASVDAYGSNRVPIRPRATVHGRPNGMLTKTARYKKGRALALPWLMNRVACLRRGGIPSPKTVSQLLMTFAKLPLTGTSTPSLIVAARATGRFPSLQLLCHSILLNPAIALMSAAVIIDLHPSESDQGSSRRDLGRSDLDLRLSLSFTPGLYRQKKAPHYFVGGS